MYNEEVRTERKFKSFNYFSKEGKNVLNAVTPRPMTLDEAMDYFDALTISGN